MRYRTMAAVLLAALAIGACSSDDMGDFTEAESGEDSAAAPAEGDMDIAVEEAEQEAEEAAEEPMAATDEGAADAPRTAGDGNTSAVLNVGVPLGRKVITTATLSIEVEDTQATIDAVTRMVERAGGFVADADLRREGEDQLHGRLVVRVPARDLGSTLTAIEQLADTVTGKQIGTDDVTSEYADIEAQLRNLQALELQLLDLLDEIRETGDNADELLLVFQRIREVRGEIERLQGRQKVLDDLVDLATIELQVSPTPAEVVLTLGADDGWSPRSIAAQAIDTTVGALQGLATATIWLGLVLLPLLLVFAVPLLVLALAYRRVQRRREPEPVVSEG